MHINHANTEKSKWNKSYHIRHFLNINHLGKSCKLYLNGEYEKNKHLSTESISWIKRILGKSGVFFKTFLVPQVKNYNTNEIKQQ